MPIDFGTGQVGIKADLSDLGKSFFSSLKSLFSQAGDESSKSFSSNLSTGIKAGLLAVSALATKGIHDSIKQFETAASEVRTLQRELGLTAEDASKLRAAGAELGISVEQLSGSFGVFSKHLVDGGASFEKYGITLRKASGEQKSFDELLGEVADKFSQLPAGPQQAAFAMDLFGRSGKALIPLLAQGSAGIQDLMDKAHQLGLVLSQEDVDAAKRAAAAQRELSLSWQGLKIQLGRDFLPVQEGITKGLRFLTTALHAIPAPIRTTIAAFAAGIGPVTALGGVMQGVSATMEVFPALASRIAAAFSAVSVAMGGATATLGVLLVAIIAADEAWKALHGDISDYTTATINGARVTNMMADRLVFVAGVMGRTGATMTEALAAWRNHLTIVRLESDHTATAIQRFGGEIIHFAGMTGAKLQEWRAGTVAGFNSVAGVLDKLAQKAHLTAGEVLRAFTRQLAAMRDYRSNWEALLRRGLPDDLLKQLQEMGLGGAVVVAALAHANNAHFERIINIWGRARGVARGLSSDIIGIQHAIDALHGKEITIKVNRDTSLHGVGGSPPPPPHHITQHGFDGIVRRATTFLAGEAGPEHVRVTPLGSGASGGRVARMETVAVVDWKSNIWRLQHSIDLDDFGRGN